MLMSDRGGKKKRTKKKPEGADAFLNGSLDSSFKESTMKSMEDDQDLLKSRKLGDTDEDHVRRMKMLLEVDKPDDELEAMNTISSNYNFVLDDVMVKAT
jgi:hypothetical protein